MEREHDYALVLVGTKVDLRCTAKNTSDPQNYFNNFENIVALAKEYRIPYIETSAKDKVNVDLVFRQCLYEYWFQTNVPKEDRKYC